MIPFMTPWLMVMAWKDMLHFLCVGILSWLDTSFALFTTDTRGNATTTATTVTTGLTNLLCSKRRKKKPEIHLPTFVLSWVNFVRNTWIYDVTYIAYSIWCHTLSQLAQRACKNNVSIVSFFFSFYLLWDQQNIIVGSHYIIKQWLRKHCVA